MEHPKDFLKKLGCNAKFFFGARTIFEIGIF